MIPPQIRMGWVTALPHPSGGQRSSWDSPILLTEAPDQGASSRRGPEYLLPSVLGYRVLELAIKPHCIVGMMGVWLHRALGFEGFFFTYMYTCHKLRELEKCMDGIIS